MCSMTFFDVALWKINKNHITRLALHAVPCISLPWIERGRNSTCMHGCSWVVATYGGGGAGSVERDVAVTYQRPFVQRTAGTR
jgi:hypothetical protein